MFTLDLLNTGSTAKICNISDNLDLKLRLLDIGFVNGSRIECLYLSPFKGLTAYKVKDTVIALRKEDASLITVECYE